MTVNIVKRTMAFLMIISTLALLSCNKSDIIDYNRISCARRVYDASVNVYTGTLIDFELYEERFGNYTDTYKIKVQVKEVFKGNFKEGETVEDLCPLGFFDKNCDYMFMTGVNKEYGYNQNSFIKAENAYSGKILNVKLQKKDENGTPFYDIKIEVNRVYKGEYKVGQIVEDTIVSRLEEIGEDDIIISCKEDPYIGNYRWDASLVVYNDCSNGFGTVKLLENGKIELAQGVGRITEVNPGVEFGILPPKTYNELIAQISEPLDYQSEPFILETISTAS